MVNGMMKQLPLRPEKLLEKVSEYHIFRHYMPRDDWKINVVTFSPFRNEKTPSFIIGNKYDRLTFIDFGDTSKKGSCFDFVCALFNINLNEALKMIDKDLGLGMTRTTDTQEYKRIVSEYKQPIEMPKVYTSVQAVVKRFTNEELDYWNHYHISEDELKANHVYSLSKVYLNKQLVTSSLDELRFGYLYDDRWKIYRPFAKDKRYKWVPNNVPITAMDGKEDIKHCNVALITKSRKDYMVMKKIFPSTCAVQNEGLGCFSPANVEYIKSNSASQVLSFDSDETGINNSIQITKMFDFDYINVPRKYLSQGIKDWSDLVCTHGYDPIIKYFKEKELI